MHPSRSVAGSIHLFGPPAEIARAIRGRVRAELGLPISVGVNAVEAMSGPDEGSRELLISTEQDGANGVRVAVRDWGPGLKPESLDQLFDAFYTTKPDGMGMGLSICRSIIEAHGGRVWAAPNPPRGAAFRFTLPQ